MQQWQWQATNDATAAGPHEQTYLFEGENYTFNVISIPQSVEPNVGESQNREILYHFFSLRNIAKSCAGEWLFVDFFSERIRE